jgi:FHS family glucose/mannose:H+ symporter-like MFS transporter
MSTNSLVRRNLIIVITSAAIFLFGGGLITLGSVIPDIKLKFSLDDIGVGSIFSILPFGILTGSLLFGPIADRFGFKIMLSISCLLMGIGMLSLAFTDSFTLLRLGVLLFGIGGGAVNGGTSAIVSDISEKKAAALSLLGVFFGLGALIFPLIFASSKDLIANEVIILILALLCFAVSLSLLFANFPKAKQHAGFPLGEAAGLIRQKLLLLIALFLFCQSSFEGLVNNWTTLYLTTHFTFDISQALYALSALMIGMTITRLITATALASVDPKKIIYSSLLLLFAGVLLLQNGSAILPAAAGLFLIGAGLAGGFPIMLSLVGKSFSALSATAFSVVLVIALFGNMLVNYLMGIVANIYGIGTLITFCLSETVLMLVLSVIIFNQRKEINI